MAVLHIHKALSALPNTLEPNTIYLVRVNTGFDLYCTDTTGNYAHTLNSSSSNSMDRAQITAMIVAAY